MDVPKTLLGGLSPEEFLRDVWQKKPLLIRGALPGFESPISPEELAGLACEEGSDSRLIMERGGEYPWQLRHGPFEDEDFLALPESHWTLLVQEVDRWVPEIAGLLNYFRFIPNWRIDDVMVSYAPDQGNVGAHVDNYDVFLFQALGKREWRIGLEPLMEEDIDEELEVSMLRRFEPDETWVLEPGDMLYLPPRIPHHGIARGDCMTFSIGFRAPSREEVLAGFSNHLLEVIDPLERYGDPDLRPQAEPGLLSEKALEEIRRFVREGATDEAIDRWFGSFVTEPKRSEVIDPPERPWSISALTKALRDGAVLERLAPTRFAYLRKKGGEVSLFVHGDEYALDAGLEFAAPILCGVEPLDGDSLSDRLRDRDFVELLAALVNDGHLLVVE